MLVQNMFQHSAGFVAIVANLSLQHQVYSMGDRARKWVWATNDIQ